MRCENCLHYGVCTFAKQYETVDKCTDFADKDLYIKFPCKVGDAVYQRDTGGRIYETVIKTIIYDTGGIAFDERAIGKTVFLTREDAEKNNMQRKTVQQMKQIEKCPFGENDEQIIEIFKYRKRKRGRMI